LQEIELSPAEHLALQEPEFRDLLFGPATESLLVWLMFSSVMSRAC
jgi:hypothetical protein